jgi:hypothetical protein
VLSVAEFFGKAECKVHEEEEGKERGVLIWINDSQLSCESGPQVTQPRGLTVAP